jgi:hypothetical protein
VAPDPGTRLDPHRPGQAVVEPIDRDDVAVRQVREERGERDGGRGDAVREEQRGLAVRFAELADAHIDPLVAVVEREDAVTRVAADLVVDSNPRLPDSLVEAHLSRAGRG